MKVILQSLVLLCITSHVTAGGKLLGTSGVSQIEGSGGGGLVPWATISGYTTRDELGGSAFFSAVSVDDFRMSSYGASYAYKDRIEVSFAHQDFRSDDKTIKLSQDIAGFKLRLMGDVVFSYWPQIALGLQYKDTNHAKTISAFGAKNDQGIDFYLAATKAWLDGPLHRTFVLNTTLRYTKANQIGLQGFGGDTKNEYKALLEASAGFFLSRYWVLGAEYRQKPDQLSALKEDDWKNLFLAYFPNKNAAFTFALVDLGRLGGKGKQKGAYLSLQLAY